MTRAGHALAVVAAVLAFAQAGSPPPRAGSAPPRAGATPTSGAIDQIERSVTRPVPSVRPSPSPTPDRVWVPGRVLRTLDGGSVQVPGHWEKPLPTGDRYVPSLTVCSPDGRCATAPAGTRPPPDQRQTP